MEEAGDRLQMEESGVMINHTIIIIIIIKTYVAYRK